MRIFAEKYISVLKDALDQIPLEKVLEVADLLVHALEGGQQIFVFGNGGSASTASHFACDINKGVSFGLERRFRMICLNDNLPVILAYANDESYDDIFKEQLKNFLRPNDLVIGISGSGNSENVIKAIQYSNESGAKSIAFTGFDGGKLTDIAKISFIITINDMQKIEDIHLILCHMITQMLYNKLGSKTHG